MKKYQICTRNNKNTITVDWDKIPDKYLGLIPPTYIYNIMYINEEGSIMLKSVIFFRPVSKFGKSITKSFEFKEIEFGI